MKMCLKCIDRIIGKLLDSIESNESIVIINSLSQKNVFKNGVCIYRQIDTRKFFNSVNINYSKFEEGMTNDIQKKGKSR